MELIGKLESNDTPKIGILPCASKYVSIKFKYQCIHILNNKDRLNGIKGSTKIQKIWSILKHQSHFYNVQRNSDVNHRDMKMQRNKKLFPPFNVINGKPYPYGRTVIQRHYHYWLDHKLVPVVVAIIRIPCSCHAFTTILSLPWDWKIKKSCKQPRYGRVYNCK